MNGGNDKNPKLDGAGKLIGGYGAGNLTRREEELLLEAALHDQEIFDALMEEQGLKELLEEPGVRADLIRSLQPKLTVWGRLKKWMAAPVAWGTAGAFATAAVVLVVLATRSPQGSTAVQLAKVPAATQEVGIAAPATLPEAASKRNQAQELSDASAVRKQPREQPAPPPAASPGPTPEVPAPVLQAYQQQQAQPPQQQAGRQQAGPPQRQSNLAQQAPSGRTREEKVASASPPAQQQAGQVAELQKEVASPPRAEARRDASSASRTEQDRLARAPMAGLASSEPVQAMPLFLDYALLRRNAQGVFEPVTGTAVSSTDVLRLQVIPGSDGLLSVSQRSDDGIQRLLVSGLRLARGQVVSVPQQSYFSADARNLVVQFTRIPAPEGVMGGAVGAAKQGFRQNVPGSRAKTAAAPASGTPPPGVLPKKVALPAGPAVRTAADSAAANELVLEITIRTN